MDQYQLGKDIQTLLDSVSAIRQDLQVRGTTYPETRLDEYEALEATERDENFACNDICKVEHRDASGKLIFIREIQRGMFYPMLHIKYDPKNSVAIRWWCGNDAQTWHAPVGTRYISIYRKLNGSGNIIYYR